MTEPVYLANLAKTHPNLAVMDRKLIMIGNGKSRVEFCDLYSKALDVVHVKQYGPGGRPTSSTCVRVKLLHA
jgi:uncharacterized protein (TIGR04141 family)